MRKEQEQIINGVKFKVTQLGFADGMELLTRLGRLIGPSLKDAHNEPGRWPVLEPEVDLAGRYDLATRWLAFALEVNYGDFFTEGALLSGVINRAALIELERYWSIDDVADAHQVLDYFGHLEYLELRAMKKS